MDRRDFLSATAAGLGLAASAAGAAETPKSKKKRLGLIGCGWYGMVDTRHQMQVGGDDLEVVSLCDPDKAMLDAAAAEVEQKQKGHRPAMFADFREMLNAKNLDVVVVGSPDHWHALHGIAAMEAGADVYLEKPICHTFAEGQALVKTARRLNRVVQIGTQRRSTPHIVQAREFVRAGNLGHIGVVRAYCQYQMRGTDNPPDSEPPATLDYDLWTGPAPLRPYNKLVHPRSWRKFNEYGNGILGDMGVHMLDTARWVLGVRYPKSVFSVGGVYAQKAGRANIEDTQTVLFDYGDMQMVWEHRTYGPMDKPGNGWGVTFYGDMGMLNVTLADWTFTPTGGGKAAGGKAEVEADPAKQEDPLVRVAGRAHNRDFLGCTVTRNRPVADVEEGHVSTALCLLGNISMRVGRSLRWDGEREQIVGDEEATKLLRREYRKPWVYPEA